MSPSRRRGATVPSIFNPNQNSRKIPCSVIVNTIKRTRRLERCIHSGPMRYNWTEERIGTKWPFFIWSSLCLLLSLSPSLQSVLIYYFHHPAIYSQISAHNYDLECYFRPWSSLCHNWSSYPTQTVLPAIVNANYCSEFNWFPSQHNIILILLVRPPQHYDLR